MKPEEIEPLIIKAEDTPGCKKLAESLRSAMRNLREERAKLDRWMLSPEMASQQARNIPAVEARIVSLEEKVDVTIKEITAKIQANVAAIIAKDAVVISPALQAIIDAAEKVISTVLANPYDSVPSSMLALAVPDAVTGVVLSKGRWYRRQTTAGYLEQLFEDELAEEIFRALSDGGFSRIVGTAIQIATEDDDAKPSLPVLKGWATYLRDYRTAYRHLPSDERMIINDDLYPITFKGAEAPMFLHRKTGELAPAPPPDTYVLYPPIELSETGETRALDAMVNHHFKTEEERNAFYETCGISMFGYGIPNLTFLLGSGGSGKDMLFLMMRTVLKLVCSINSQTLTGNDESNDLVRLQNARMALCAFESSHQFDGSFKPATLKTITSGGANPISARAKYAKEAVEISYRGALWLYGNKAPNLAGGGDFDGMDRRLMILPMTAPLDKAANPPKGFTSWEDAVSACSPVFGWRCLDAFIKWHSKGRPGYSDVRLRIPQRWREFTAEVFFSGSRFGFLRDIFICDSDHGLQEHTLNDVMGLVMQSNSIRIGRAKFIDTLKDTLPVDTKFVDGLFMRPKTTDGAVRYPVTIVRSALRAALDNERFREAEQILTADGGWHPEAVEAMLSSNRTVQNRAVMRGEQAADFKVEELRPVSPAAAQAWLDAARKDIATNTKINNLIARFGAYTGENQKDETYESLAYLARIGVADPIEKFDQVIAGLEAERNAH